MKKTIICFTLIISAINIYLLKDFIWTKQSDEISVNKKIKKNKVNIVTSNKKNKIKKNKIKKSNKISKSKVIYKKIKKYNNCSNNDITKELSTKFKTNDFFKEKNYISKIAIIDTGLDIHNIFFKNKYFVPKKLLKNNSLNFGIDLVKNTTEPFDTHGHGSHVAGLILSINPNAKILPIKYYNPQDSGEINMQRFIKALKIAIDANVDIINISGGGPSRVEEEYQLIKKAKEKGILIVSAIGNESSSLDNDPYYPAYYGEDNLLNVMAHNNYYRKPSFSNWGDLADVSTFGQNILSFGVSSNLKNSCLINLNGTSQSTAIISGFASLIKNKLPNLNYKSIKNIIKMSTTNAKDNKTANVFDYKSLYKILFN